jgi:hypothetical protein
MNYELEEPSVLDGRRNYELNLINILKRFYFFFMILDSLFMIHIGPHVLKKYPSK